ncbi:MAG: aminoglycoside phosphotransferase family protein [Gaiellaceae bacterium]
MSFGQAEREAFRIGYGWLALAVPASARRFRSLDGDIRHTLEQAGGTLVDGAADVEIGVLRHLRGDAGVTVVLAPTWHVGATSARWRRVADRIGLGLAMRVWLTTTAFRLRRRHLHARRLFFDMEQSVSFDRVQASTLAQRLPRGAAVVASRAAPGRSLLAEVCDAAARSTGRRFTDTVPTLRAGLLLLVTADDVLRVAIGDGHRQLDDQVRVLRALRALSPSAAVEPLVPEVVGEGTTGLARWTVETRLPGRPSPHVLTAGLIDQSVEFIVGLGGLHRGESDGSALLAAAEVVVRALGRDETTRVVPLARHAAETLTGVPTVFGHGDFCSTNLLELDGRLSGVVDWEGGGTGVLPLLDLLHLLLLHETQPDVYAWGRAVSTHLVPIAERTGGHVQDYLDRLELSFDESERQALAVSYWLTRIAHQLSSYASRAADPRWVEQCVHAPARALAGPRAPA